MTIARTRPSPLNNDPVPFKLVVCQVKDIEIIRGVPCWSNPTLDNNHGAHSSCSMCGPR
uniref:Uncharacterized protein n=1 Tax=Arundo donax TaxID=35708 RepID=A0A0A8YFY2_ARUDO